MALGLEPKLIIPIEGLHVSHALAVARADQDIFRKAEMSWLEEHNAKLWLYFMDLYDKTIRVDGIVTGDARLAGNTLGHHAVRLCVEGGSDYELVKNNFDRNIKLDERNAGKSDEPWNTEGKLNRIFADQKLTGALLEIKHDVSRDAAAVTIGFMCLQEIPEPVSLVIAPYI